MDKNTEREAWQKAAQPVALTAEQVDRCRKLTLDYAIAAFDAGGARMVNTVWVVQRLEELKLMPLDVSVITGGHIALPPVQPPAQSEQARDAERYRWLRNPDRDVALVIDKQTGWVPPDDAVPGVGGYWTYEYRAGEELDAAIDDAMQARKRNG